MLSLFSLANFIRKGVIIFMVFSIVVVTLDIIGKLLNPPQETFVPDVSNWTDTPRNSFGDIVFPEIPSLNLPQGNTPNYTIVGEFADFPDTAYVYQIEKPRQKLNSVETAKRVASLLGFESEGYSKRDTDTYVWENTRRTRQLVHNVVARTWDFHTVSYFQDAEALRIKETDKTRNYGSSIKSLVGSLGLSDDSLRDGYTGYDLVKRSSDRFVPIQFNEEPEYASGSVYRKLTTSTTKPGITVVINGKETNEYSSFVYTNGPEVGSAYMVVADEATLTNKDIFEFKFTQFEYSNNRSLYYVLSPSLAWQNVQLGKGKIMLLVTRNGSKFDPYVPKEVREFNADATKTELAYYEPEDWTGYAYPIFIFRGTAELVNGELANFTIYVDALRR